MAASLDIHGNASGASKALKDVKDAVSDVKTEMKQADAAADQLSDSVSGIGEPPPDNSWLDDLRKDLAESEKQAKQTGSAVEGIGGGGVTGKLTALFSGITAGIGIVKGLAQAASDARGYIKDMADQGVPAFQRLNDKIGEVETKWDALVTRAASSNAGQAMLGGIIDYADQAVEGLDALGDTTNTLATQWNALGSAIAGAVGATSLEKSFDKRISQLSAEAMAQRQAILDEQDRQKVAKQTGDIEKIKADLAKSREAERLQNAVNEITDLRQIVALRNQELATMEKLAKEGNLTDDKRQASLQKIGTLENRRRTLLSEQAAERKRQLEEQARAEERAAKEEYDAQVKAAQEYADLMEKQAKEEEARLAKEVRDREAAEKAKLDAAEKAAAEKQARIDNLAGADQVKGVASQIQQQAADPRALIERLASNAGEKGSDEYRKAYRQATMQAQGGAKVFSDEEVAQAQQQNAQAITGSLQQSGKLSADMVDALKQVIGTAQQFDQQQAQMQQQVGQIMQLLGDVNKSVRGRAQKMGAKQI